MNLSCGVIVPTYRRVDDLARCLAALEQQERKPDEVVVVYRKNDEGTREYLASAKLDLPLTISSVERPGVVAALNVGLLHIRSQIVAMTDDDAAPRADWLARIEQHFLKHPAVGGVGGRDHVHGVNKEPESRLVGRIQWFGRTIHRHHLGVGEPRFVECLKGVNMAFRREAIGPVLFDERLRGSGAQVHNEMVFCLEIVRRGWKLLYDPAVAVDHYPSIRYDEDGRQGRTLRAVSDSAFNETIALLEYLPWHGRIAFWLWAFAVGHDQSPGLLVCLVRAPMRWRAWQEFGATVNGRVAAGLVAGRRADGAG